MSNMLTAAFVPGDTTGKREVVEISTVGLSSRSPAPFGENRRMSKARKRLGSICGQWAFERRLHGTNRATGNKKPRNSLDSRDRRD